MKEILFAVSLVIYSASSKLLKNDCPEDCLCQNITIHCERNTLKEAIPSGLLEANLFNFVSSSLSEQVENVSHVHDSWVSVTKLIITLKIPRPLMYLANRSFEGLTNLTFLGIHGVNSDMAFSLSYETFFGLDSLRTLDLSGNPSLYITEVTNALTKADLLPNLKVINLEHLQTFMCTPISQKMSNDFLKTLRDRKIEKLILDGTQIKVDFNYLRNICGHLKVLSIKSAEVIAPHNGENFVCHSLKELDLTNASVPILQNILTFRTELSVDLLIFLYEPFVYLLRTFNKFTRFLFSVETLNLDYFLSCGARQFSFDRGRVLDMKRLHFKVKKMSFRKNRLKNLNVSFQNIPFPDGTEIDVSDNVIEYIHPKFLVPGKAIRKINLAGNKLYQMEKDYPAVFSVFLHIFTNLEEINLSYNKIKSLPQNLLSKNVILKSLNISGNMIYTLSIDISSHSNLQYLDISENRLSTLSNKNMADLEKHASDFRTFAGNDNSTQNKSFVLYIFRNDFTCDCENLSFMSWFKWAPFISEKHQHYFTYDDKKYALKGNAFEEVANECKLRTFKRNLAIGISSSVFLIFLTIFSAFSFQRYRQKRNKIKSYIRTLRNIDEEHFLAFLSFCSEDTDFVFTHLANKLNDKICIKTKRKAEYICIGDKHFRPGFPVITEIMSKIENSAVAIFVISQIFCEKAWCHMEVQEAMELQKPVVLIFKEEVDERNMPKLIKKLFRQNTRCKIVQEANGRWTPQPSWDVLTLSIIELAIESYCKSLDK